MTDVFAAEAAGKQGSPDRVRSTVASSWHTIVPRDATRAPSAWKEPAVLFDSLSRL